MSYSNNRSTNHDEMYPLLPWLVNDTLSPTQRDLAMEHVSTCDICQEEIRLLRSLNNELASSSQSNYESKANLEGNLSSVMQRIEAEQKSGASPSSLVDQWRSSVEHMSDTFSFYLKRPWVAPALLGGLLFVTIGSWNVYEQQQGDFSVLSSPQKPASTAQLAVEFEPGMHGAEAKALIDNQMAGYANEIAVERLESGVYLIGFESEVELSQLNKILGELQALKNVSSAELR